MIKRGLWVLLLVMLIMPVLAQEQKFFNTFIYRIGGNSLVDGDEVVLAKYDLVYLNRFVYDDINGDSWGAIKAINPNTDIYLYQLGKATSIAQDSKPDQGLNTIARWSDGDGDQGARGHSKGDLHNDNPELFLYDSSGNRVFNHEYTNSYFLDFGSSRLVDYWLEATIGDIVGQPYKSNRPWTADGVFLDVCSSIEQQARTTPVKYNTVAKWSAAMNNYASSITDGLHGAGQKASFNRCCTRNIDGGNAWKALDSFSVTPDVVFEEGAFVTRWGPADAQFYPENEWKRQVDLLGQIHNSKVGYQSSSDLIIGQSGIDNKDKGFTFLDALWYGMASYQIGKNTIDHNSYFGFDEGYSTTRRYEEFDHIDLGRSIGTYKVSNINGNNIYWREFEKGYVYVNPTNNNVASIPLPETCRQLTHTNFKNNPSTIPTTNSISLNSHRGVFILKQDTTTCIPDWDCTSCTDWSTCTGTQTRTCTCTDNNNCQPDYQDVQSQQCNVNTGLVSWYTMDNIAGSILPDNEGSNDCSVGGAIIAPGRIGNALDFDGTDDSINCGNSMNIGVGGFTINAWIYPEVLDNTQYWDNVVFSKYQDADNRFYFRLRKANIVQFYAKVNGAAYGRLFMISNNFDKGSWHMMTLVLDRAQNEMKIYHNGARSSVTYTEGIGFAGADISNQGDSVIGAVNREYFFNGAIDEMKIFNYALSDSEVADLLNLGCVPLTDLMSSMDQWKANALTISDLLLVIQDWKSC